MYSAFMGGLIGLAIAAALLALEYVAVVRLSRERAKKQASKRIELDSSERARLRGLGWFCLLLPGIFAGLGWLIW